MGSMLKESLPMASLDCAAASLIEKKNSNPVTITLEMFFVIHCFNFRLIYYIPLFRLIGF
jgi:hypothetical protein